MEPVQPNSVNICILQYEVARIYNFWSKEIKIVPL